MTAYKTETKLTQIGNGFDELGAVNAPIYLSTAYRHEGIGVSKGYDYIRTGNPTRSILEKAIASIEGGEEGFACSSGMSAIQLVFSLFQSGDHIIASRDLYGGTYRLFEILARQYRITFTYWDGASYEKLASLVEPQTKAIFIETPTNPLMRETDISEVSYIARKNHLLLIVDNTFYTPVLQKPIEEGADLVVHSATKYLGGHNDVLAGLVVSNSSEVTEKLRLFHNSCGLVLDPFDSWLLIRGMKTLALRMRQHETNARRIVSYLNDQLLVTRVLYPGKGGMVSFELSKEIYVQPFLKALRLITFAESLGGVESLITYPATQTHADIPEADRLKYGLSNSLLRLSTGIEHPDDLINDLDQAFQSLKKGVALHG
ncbi:methionine biosynthesis PLP-dependent protein [Sporolactobacillus putidus]|uniref:Cystathionine gamma-synthase n=1 Tax=Sporolactobacillus putidus TaxID=492735 RepID=A0A917W275_9BACL|nr:methionine biosynthesis PLP-dependent protein [Sporolactobacillus putidus]GGL52868.1 cystathionine gamma-synthase [Sporolactobacillus putidus]